MLVRWIQRGWNCSANFSVQSLMKQIYPSLQEVVTATLKPTHGNYWLMLVIKKGFTKPFYLVRPLNFSSTFELYYPKLKVQQSIYDLEYPYDKHEDIFPSSLLLMAQGLFNYCIHSSFLLANILDLKSGCTQLPSWRKVRKRTITIIGFDVIP